MPYYGAIQNPYFRPAEIGIIAITNANPAVVTTGTVTLDSGNMQVVTAVNNNYKSQLIVRIRIPDDYGMKQLNKFKGTITVLSSTTFSIPIDTTTFDQFVIPVQVNPQPLTTPAQAVPIGEDTSILTQSFVNILTPQF